MNTLSLESSRKIAEDLANKIAFLQRMVFHNEGIPVYVIPYDNKEWEEETAIAAYNSVDDYYVVVTKNIYKLTITTEAGLFGTAAHEVRHRFQKNNPKALLSKDFLVKEEILKQDYVSKIQTMNKNSLAWDFNLELDSMVIEEITRNICGNLTLRQIVEEKGKVITALISCDENTLLDFID